MMKKTLLVACLLAGATGLYTASTLASKERLPAPSYDSSFWATWGDGRAELAGYDLEFPRYGQVRTGKAVTVFVTEPFHEKTRVKADNAGDFKVLKLNFVEDFQTGIYDYNLMTSAFLRVTGNNTGHPSKVSFSAQEWCGHAYSHLLFDKDNIRETSHSYFDGEADSQRKLALPGDAISEDTLMFWARGLSAPVVEAGQKRAVSMLPALKDERLKHRALKWKAGELSRASGTEKVTVPAGTFTVRKATATWGRLTQTFFVEDAAPHRIIKWERSDGYKGELRGATRLKYWELHANGHESYLKELGFN